MQNPSSSLELQFQQRDQDQDGTNKLQFIVLFLIQLNCYTKTVKKCQILAVE